MMLSSFQILDLSEPTVRLFRVKKSKIELLDESKLKLDGKSDAAWVSSIETLCRSGISLGKLPLVILLPSRVMLYKLIRIPQVANAQLEAEQLLVYEVHEVFPHAQDELLWSYVSLGGDDVEQTFLVSGFRRETELALTNCFDRMGIKLLGLYPSFLLYCLNIQDQLQVGATAGLTQYLHFENNLAVVLAVAESGAWIRSFKLESSVISESKQSTGVSYENIKTEIRRTKAALKRQYNTAETEKLIIGGYCGDNETLANCFVEEFQPPNAIPVVRNYVSHSEQVDLLRAYDCNGEHSIANRIRLSVSTHVNRNRDKWVTSLTIAVISLLPVPFVFGNLKVVKQYAESVHRIQEQSRIQSALIFDLEALNLELDGGLLKLQKQVLLLELQGAWVQLMSDLHRALTAIQDVWLDEMDLKLEDNAKQSSLMSIGGRFLIRQVNLNESVRQEVILDTENHLKQLLGELLESSLIHDVTDFKVNYDGIEKGINVVPFSMKLVLAAPFDLRESKGDTGE